MPAKKTLLRLSRRFKEQKNRAFDPFIGLYHQLFSPAPKLPATDLFSSSGAKPHVTLFLVYQPKGLDSWTKNTLSQIKACDTDLYLLANDGLPLSDQKWLQQSGVHYAKRPNVGYDFGGYREGILWLITHKLPTRITILNDSSILPVHGNMTDIYSRISDSGYAFSGLIKDLEGSHGQISERLPSYLWSFSAELIADPVFKQFWLDYRPTSSKKLTVKRGEWGFNLAMQKAGVNSGALYDFNELVSIVKTWKLDEIEANCQLLLAKKGAARHLKETLSNNKLGANEARKRIIKLIQESNHSMLFAIWMVNFMQFPAIKRKALKSYPEAAEYFDRQIAKLK